MCICFLKVFIRFLGMKWFVCVCILVCVCMCGREIREGLIVKLIVKFFIYFKGYRYNLWFMFLDVFILVDFIFFLDEIVDNERDFF